MSKLKSVLGLIFGLLPSGRMKNVLLTRAGHNISRSATISPILIVRSSITVGSRCRIGFGTVLKDVEIDLKTASRIGQWNWISAAPAFRFSFSHLRIGRLGLDEHSALTSRHYLDCSGGIFIGKFATVAGMRSTFITHGIDVANSSQVANGIEVGQYALVGSNVKLVPGSTVPPKSVIAMGSTVAVGLKDQNFLYAGTPAVKRKAVEGAYFTRSIGVVEVARLRDVL